MPYLTPETIPEETICYTLRVPNNLDWKMIVNGAVSELIYAYNFEKFGAITPDEVAARFLEMFIAIDEGDCDMGCCHEVIEHRITSDGHMEIRIDGGDWMPDPNSPDLSGTQYPPIVMDETHGKCDAATNAASHIQDLISGVSEQLGGTGSVLEIAEAIVLILFALFVAPESIPFLAPLILPLISGLLFLGQAAWDAYFTSDVHEGILCCLYCTIGDDGTWDATSFAAFTDCLVATLPTSPARDYFVSLLIRLGVVGLNNYAALGSSASADCDPCDCSPCPVRAWIEIGTGDHVDCVYTITAVLTGGAYKAYLRFSDPAAPNNSDCGTVNWEMVSGGVGVTDFYHCVSGVEYFSGSQGDCVCLAGFTSSAPFVIQITVGAC